MLSPRKELVNRFGRAALVFRVASLVVVAAVTVACRKSNSRDGPEPRSDAPSPVQWKQYDDPKGAFRVKLVGTPTVERSEEPSQGPIKLVTTSTTASDDTRLLMITNLDLTQVVQYDCKVGLAGMAKRSLEKMGCTADTQADVTVSGKPGKDVLFTCQKQPARGRMRLLCDDHDLKNGHVRAFSLLAVYQNALWNADEVSTFLDSFVLL